MQNCNASPFAMMKNSPLAPEAYAEHPYLYNERRTPPHQRAAMVLDLLDAAHDVTAEQAMGIAFSPQVWHAELWQERIRKAAPDNGLGKILAAWDRRSDADSRAALAFYLFKISLDGVAKRAVEPPADLTDDQIRAALAKAEERLKSDFPPDAVFGTLFRSILPLNLRRPPLAGLISSTARTRVAPSSFSRSKASLSSLVGV